jgi:uncharacterized protein
MAYIEKNLEKIKILSQENRDENFRFRSFLKSIDDEKVDRTVHRIYEYITKNIDCTECGNCCKKMTPSVSKAEIKRLAKMDNLSIEEFTASYVEIDSDEGDKYLKDMPCKYLENKRCTIYIDRPGDCKSYPHIDKKGFNSRTLMMIDNYGICPIVFNVFERLKSELWS